MSVRIVQFVSVLFLAIALGASLAHLLELPNKMGLTREDYLTVQQIYRGWALLGFAVVGALLSILMLTVMLWNQFRASAWLALVSLFCIAATQVVFWTWTYPANVETQNWTVLPDHWMALRKQWEYSHAAGAALNLIAFIALTLSVLMKET